MTKQDMFKKEREDWLESARSEARHLLRAQLYITVEDVLVKCPLPKYLHHNTIGRLFQHQDFQAVGYTLTRKASSHSRVIRKWGLSNPIAVTWTPRALEYGDVS